MKFAEEEKKIGSFFFGKVIVMPPLISFYTLKFYSSFLGKSSNLSLSVMFLFHRGQLSPREIKQLDQGHPISGRDGTKVSFLIT